MLQFAFKEWAGICAALSQGRQSIILRKGGIAEETGEFQVEHQRFWLYPTYTHQQAADVRPEAADLLQEVERTRPPAGTVRLSHWAEVTGVYRVHDELLALMLAHLHFWSDDAVRKRFAYRTPGLYVLNVRVHQAPAVTEIVDTPAYQGCKSWVRLDHAIPTDGSTPVLNDERCQNVTRQLDLLLTPRALA
jgi:hypothetical protein